MEILGIIGSIASILGLIWGGNKLINNKKTIQKNKLFSIFNSGNIKQENNNSENTEQNNKKV